MNTNQEAIGMRDLSRALVTKEFVTLPHENACYDQHNKVLVVEG